MVLSQRYKDLSRSLLRQLFCLGWSAVRHLDRQVLTCWHHVQVAILVDLAERTQQFMNAKGERIAQVCRAVVQEIVATRPRDVDGRQGWDMLHVKLYGRLAAPYHRCMFD